MAAPSRAPLLDFRLLGRHQVAAALATAVDFGLMVSLVEGAHLSPAVATFLSAIGGGFANFTFSRWWAFRERHDGTLSSQGLRYAAVSLGGALLNAALLGFVLSFVHASYVVVRALVSLAVSLLYTYPMHTRLVFRVRHVEVNAPPESARFGALSQARLRSDAVAVVGSATATRASGEDAS